MGVQSSSCFSSQAARQHIMDQGGSSDDEIYETAQGQSIPINAFEMCKKGEIKEDKIEIACRLLSIVTPSEEDSDDDWEYPVGTGCDFPTLTHEQIEEQGDFDEDQGNFMRRCISLSYSVEIGEIHEREKFKWIENRKGNASRNAGNRTSSLEERKINQKDFVFRLNHIKQVIKVEICGIFKPRKRQKLSNGQQFYDKQLFVGYFNFGRCIQKSGKFCSPSSVTLRVSKGIQVRISLEEKAKKGGYRCVTLRCYDHKGGDFVENSDFEMAVLDQTNHRVLAEVSPIIGLQKSPEGLYKRIEIGINNYDPRMFVRQAFSICFFRVDHPTTHHHHLQEQEQKLAGGVGGGGGGSTNNHILGIMPRDERDILQDKLENRLVAMGSFQANEIIQSSLYQDDFIEMDPGKIGEMTVNSVKRGQGLAKTGPVISNNTGILAKKSSKYQDKTQAVGNSNQDGEVNNGGGSLSQSFSTNYSYQTNYTSASNMSAASSSDNTSSTIISQNPAQKTTPNAPNYTHTHTNNTTYQMRAEGRDDDEHFAADEGFKVPLFNQELQQQIGVVSLKQIQCKRRTSFLHLIADQMVELVPIVGIDFSMSNLTFDERKCIHSNNEEKPNEYRNLLQALSKAFKLISATALFYGFGANSVTKVTEVSDLFVGTGDLLNPIVMLDSLEKKYYECLTKVELNLPVKFASLIAKAVQFGAKAAQNFLQEQHCSQSVQNSCSGATSGGSALTYFVVYIFATGIIDDLDDSIAELAKVISLPISIVIVQLKNDGLQSNDMDVGKLEQKCEFLFQKANRRFLKVIKYADLGFQQKGVVTAMEKMTESIPFEVEQYYDSISSQTDLHRMKLRQNQIRKNFDLVREVLGQKEQFLDEIESIGRPGVTREKVNELIEQSKLYEYSIEAAEILLGLRKRVETT